MSIRKRRCLRVLIVTLFTCCVMPMIAVSAFAEELKDQGVKETNKAYDYTIETGGDSVGASAGISYGGWASLGSHLSYMKFPEGMTAPDGADGIWCYCIDISTDTKDGHKYSVTDLDAAEYYEEEAGDKIRSILLNSYPNKDIKELEEAYELSDLMEEEAFMATQWILWYYSNPEGTVDAGAGSYYPADIYKPSDYLNDTISMWYEDESGNEVRMRSSNVVKLAKALDELSPAEAYETEPADILLEKTIYEDKVIFDYSNTKGLETLKNIKIVVKDRHGKEVPFVLKENSIVVMYRDLLMEEDAAELTVSIEAEQVLSKDVYFFAPEGGRDASQSRVAVYEGKAPVAKEAVVALSRTDFEEAEKDPEAPSETPEDPSEKPEVPSEESPKTDNSGEASNVAEEPGGKGDGTPETGDDFDLLPFICVLIAAIAVSVSVLLKRNRD